MPDKTGRKTKRRPFRRVSKLFMFRFWKAKKDPERYAPRRSAIFDDRDLLYVRSYEHIHDYYIKRLDGKPPLIRMFCAMVYLDIMLLLKRGEAFSIEEYAAERDLQRKTVQFAIDELENVNLVHRERSRDGSEHIIIIVPHTPLPLDELRRQHATLLSRKGSKAKLGYIQKRRQAAGRKRDWMPEAFSWKKLQQAFNDSEDRAEKFENIVGDLVHQHITDRNYSRRQFILDVEEACAKFKLKIDPEKHHALAFEIKEYIERIV